MTRLLLLSIIAKFAAAAALTAAEPGPGEVFERRIMPIFRSPNPSSCTECHLAGVELKNYILPSSERTFRSLRDQGLIDLSRPNDSKILKLINMRDPERAGAQLITETTRQIEAEAFAEWIRACVADESLVASPPLSPDLRAHPERPPEVLRHSRRHRLLASFENTIWALRFRCMNCHTEGTKENERLRREYGERVTWIKAAGASATMDYLLRSSLLDLAHPEESLLLRKPLLRVEHGGGKKFLLGDQGYQAFRNWIEDYAKMSRDGYPDAASIPKPENFRRIGTEFWLKLGNTPAAWGDALVRVDLHPWDPQANGWQERPAATSDRQNAPKQRLWQHTLTRLIYPPIDARPEQAAPTLPDGRYQARVYVDLRHRTADDWRRQLDLNDLAGVVEFSAEWRPAYRNMTVIDAESLVPLLDRIRP